MVAVVVYGYPTGTRWCSRWSSGGGGPYAGAGDNPGNNVMELMELFLLVVVVVADQLTAK